MQKALFDFLLKYTGWLRGYRTTLGLLLSLMSIVFALASGDVAMFIAAGTQFVATLLVVVGLKPEPGDGHPPPVIPPDIGEWP